MYASAVIALRTNWRHVRRGFICALASLLLNCFPLIALAAQDSLSARQLEIIQIVLSVEGYITKELHAEFWASVPPTIRHDAKTMEAFVRTIDRSIAAGVRFQWESWASMKASLEAGRIVKTPGYAIAKKSALNASTIPSFNQHARQGVANAEAMIEAAAGGKPFQTPKGPMYITPELVNQVIAGLDGSIARFRRLVHADWEEAAVEHRYPDAHVAIISQVPFAIERQELTVENGRKVKLITLTNRLNQTDFLGITFSEYGGAWADPDGALIRTVKSTLKGTGALPSIVSSSKWRNRLSASGNGEAVTSEGTVYASTRVVEMRELGGALLFIAVTETSKIEADLLREELERSTQLLR